jgi:hypothetical protein
MVSVPRLRTPVGRGAARIVTALAFARQVVPAAPRGWLARASTAFRGESALSLRLGACSESEPSPSS